MTDHERRGTLSRRSLLGAAAILPFASRVLIAEAAAQATLSVELPPILFVHGNGDHAALWMTTLWRMESNAVLRDRLAALNFTDPLARNDNAVQQPNRSSTEDQRRELAEAVAALRQRTGAAKIALVANSRGGYAVRNYIKNGGRDISHAVLCGVPNHGVFAWDDGPGNEFNGRGPFLTALNAGETEATAGTAFLTLRSDGLDKYAQPDGRFVGKPGTSTNVTNEGPALTGATNLALGARDHRETAYHPRAFREIYKFIAGREPARLSIVPENQVRIGGIVTGTPGGVQTNRPVAEAQVEVWRVDRDSGARIGDAIHIARTGADGRWGPAAIAPDWGIEIVLSVPDAPITHVYRSPFPRSSDIVHLRAAKPFAQADSGAGCVMQMTRPTGYFGLPRDVVLLDGVEPADVKPGVPTDSLTMLRLPAADAGRSVVGQFNEERIAARTWPVAENRVAVIELTY